MKEQELRAAFGLKADKKTELLSVQEVFNGIKQLEEKGYGDAKGRAIDLYIGSTRCGKSTTLNVILGNELEVVESGTGIRKKKAFFTKVEDAEGKYPEIGEGSISKTTIPVMYEKDGQAIWDCPGFGDTRGPQQEIINAWFINRLFETAGSVKVVNLISEEALTAENPVQFMTYARQIQDIFGKTNLKTADQVVVFTKASGEFTIVQYKDALMKLLKDHFPELEALHGFFDRARTVKLDKPTDALGTKVELNYVEGLLEATASIPHKELTTNVGVDDCAKVFLHNSISALSIFAKDSVIKAYSEIYKGVQLNINATIREECTSRNLEELTTQVSCLERALVNKISETLQDKISKLEMINRFVLKIVPEAELLSQMTATALKAVEQYNANVIHYEVMNAYLDFLQANSTNFNYRETFLEAWEDAKEKLVKPDPQVLQKDLQQLCDMAHSVQQDLNSIGFSNDKATLEANKKITEKYRKDLDARNAEYEAAMSNYAERLRKYSEKSWITKLFHSAPKDQPQLQMASKDELASELDRDLFEYIEANQLVGEVQIADYFDFE